ncbi:endonuclease III [Gelria sp. Kuro-4]|uniref:endonuclease III n=1 Tax=Gelria sp. Kuro-4 TaxID=2796927 RepID=UPI001BF16DF1|nr:endonuclease III [Gelria sp. Kuro-4]BCV25069.1 endonuclease III [Gelria sp. Kuro-4]
MAKRIPDLLGALAAAYPAARTELVFHSPFELLVATMLSAQTTDRQVNRVTPLLFARYPTPEALAAADPEVLAGEIAGVGLNRTKARHLVSAAQRLAAVFHGQVPPRLEDLLTLPGVGRKTAKVVLANAFGIPGLAVDTHVFRVARRLGLSAGRTPLEVEKDLEAQIPPTAWTATHHRLIQHGRRVCRARNPRCASCPLGAYCLFRTQPEKSTD